MTDESMELDMALASLHADVGDLKTLLRLIATKLQEALGSRMEVERAGGMLHRSDDVRRLRITIDDDDFEAVADGGDVRCSVGHRSGGIRIRSERIDGDAWFRRLTDALKAEAARSDTLRRALETMVIGGSS